MTDNNKDNSGRWRGILIAAGVFIAALFIGVCTTAGPRVNTGEVPPDRLSGADRFETAVEVSQFRYPDGAEHVYIAAAGTTAGAFADALVATPLDGPILLVPSCDGVPDVVADEVRRLAPAQVTVIGGEAAVCAATEVELREL